jgi:ferredoxin
MEMEPGPTNRDDEIKWDVLQNELDVPAAKASPAPEEQPKGGRLPVLPDPAVDTSEPAQTAGLHNQLLTFFYYGKRDKEADTGAPALRPAPALLFQYGDLSIVRHEYPICLSKNGPGAPGLTITQVFNQLIEEEGEDTDEKRRFKQHALRLEVAVRTMSSGVGTPGQLSDLCSKATDMLIETTTLPKDRTAKFREDLEKATEKLPMDGDVVSCGPETPSRMFEAAMGAFWNERSKGYLAELDVLIRETQDILTADDGHSAEAKTAGHLAGAAAEEDGLDYEAMSEILSASKLGQPLPEERRKRIELALETLRKVRPLYAGDEEKPPFPMETVAGDCRAAIELYRARMSVMADFFKSVRIAQLEIDNKYRKSMHDPFFDHFDPSELTDRELSYCPPVLLGLTPEFFASDTKIALFQLLTSGAPIKVLSQIDDLHGLDENGNALVTPAWRAQIGAMAAALGNVYVMQSPVSHPSFIQSGMMEGLRYNGPALFNVYNPEPVADPELDTFLLAAASEESRLFPSFTYDPGKGETLADRMDVRENRQTEGRWSKAPFVYQNTMEEQFTVELPFTPADMMLADARFHELFWNVPPSMWLDEMVPLDEFLEPAPADDDDAETDDRIPYTLAVDPELNVARVVVARQALIAVDRAAQSWRGLQEMGGIDNSHALALISQEKERLEEEKQREVGEVEKKYTLELERDLGELSQEIISRIAAQLIAQGQGAPTLGAFPAPAPVKGSAPAAPAEEAAAPTEVEEAEEEDEVVTFDDPYIDTPLCTSCNDCMKINAQLFLYNENKQAYLGDLSTATFEQLVKAAEKCPVHIIHPGKPKNPNEPNLDDLVARAAKFN